MTTADVLKTQPVTTAQPVREPIGERRDRKRPLLPIIYWVVIGITMIPILVMIIYSFNAVPAIEPIRQTPKFQGFTFQWWRDPFGVAGLPTALRNSLTIAPVASVIATILGTLLGLALGRYRFRGKAPVNFIIFLAIAVPEIVFGSSLLSLFIKLNFVKIGYTTILISHVAFSIPFVAVTVRARVQGLDRSLEDAAQDLFANPITAFFKVTFPLILPGIVSGFLLAFVLSLDDFVITNFVSGSVQTFPIWVFGATRIGLPPQVNVMGTLLFSAGILAAITNVLVQRRRSRA
jgi:spermidine/putrescine transport system permease protein